jgi:hypothetical protein
MVKQKGSCCCGTADKKEIPSCGCGTVKEEVKEECSCGSPVKDITGFQKIRGAREIRVNSGAVIFVPVKLCSGDLFKNFLARFGFKRMNYAVKPGLYAAGTPDKRSPVLVCANYKMSFDALRKELYGISAWILVLDSKGVNVWCAAGKGTFGTRELVKRISLVKLDKIVSHRELIVPQLGAPGIQAHMVRKLSKFRVVYGPVEASDIKAFLADGMKVDEKQRTVTFGLKKRIEVIGVEFMTALKTALAAAVIAVIAAGFTKAGFSPAAGLANSLYFIEAMGLAVLSSTVIPAALLPLLPGRMFSVKGAVSGLAVSAVFVLTAGDMTLLTRLSIILLSTALSAFVFMNYTGSTTFTSLTGVRKEISVSVPPIIGAALAGMVLQITDFVIKGGIKWN